MTAADAALALQRHATSKIRLAADLVGVPSFGFRGEALPAIASVSQLELETCDGQSDGTWIRSIAGEVAETRPMTRRCGTTVSVSRLFFNAPARQRFLRSARSEWRATADALITLALLRRDVRIVATSDGRAAITLPPTSSLRPRIGALWGGAFAERLVDVNDVHGVLHVAGLVERPGDVGTAARRVFLAVNGRAIRDAGLVRAAEAAFRSTIPAGMRPTLFLEIRLPADMVDVNVHPTKAEVRFRERWLTERAVENAVRRALGAPESAAAIGGRGWSGGWTPPSAPGPADLEAIRSSFEASPSPLSPLHPADTGADTAGTQDGPTAGSANEAAGIEVPALVQLRRTYLICERESGVVLIDQHSAHERVLFERFMATLEGGESPSQRLLFPMTLHLGPSEADAFEENRPWFERLGFEIEGFGGHTLMVSSVPMPHPRFDAERCLRDTLAALSGDRHAGTAARHERLAATLACKAAIKAGDALSLGEMRALYVALARTTLPAHDVHGRSTIVHLSWDELERRFGRR